LAKGQPKVHLPGGQNNQKKLGSGNAMNFELQLHVGFDKQQSALVKISVLGGNLL